MDESDKNDQLMDPIKIVDDLEQYIFEKIYSNLTFRAKIHHQIKLDHLNLVKLNYTIFDKSIACQTVSNIQVSTPLNFFKLIHSKTQILKNAIYHLYHQGLFKESEEDRIKRLCNKPVKAVFANINREDNVNKLDFEFRPKHYHEVLEAIQNYRNIVNSGSSDKINSCFSIVRSSYSSHYDCMNQSTLPAILKKFLQQGISRSYKTFTFDRIFKQTFYQFVENYIEKFSGSKFEDLNELYKNINLNVHPKIIEAIKSEITLLKKEESLYEKLHHQIKGKNEFKNFIDEQQFPDLTEHDIYKIFPKINLRQIFPGQAPRKAIQPLSIAEQMKMSNQQNSIKSALFYSPQQLKDFQIQFEAYSDWKEDIKAKIDSLNNELCRLENPDNLFQSSKIYLLERPDLKSQLKENCVIKKKIKKIK